MYILYLFKDKIYKQNCPSKWRNLFLNPRLTHKIIIYEDLH